MIKQELQKIISELQNGSDQQRRAASYKLGKSKDPEAVPALINAYNDSDGSVRQNVINGLRSISSPEALEFLRSHENSFSPAPQVKNEKGPMQKEQSFNAPANECFQSLLVILPQLGINIQAQNPGLGNLQGFWTTQVTPDAEARFTIAVSCIHVDESSTRVSITYDPQLSPLLVRPLFRTPQQTLAIEEKINNIFFQLAHNPQPVTSLPVQAIAEAPKVSMPAQALLQTAPVVEPAASRAARIRSNINSVEAAEFVILGLVAGTLITILVILMLIFPTTPGTPDYAGLIMIPLTFIGVPLALFVLWGVYRLYIYLARLGGPIIDVGLWVGAAAITASFTFWCWSILDINRLIMSKLFYKGEAPVEYAWSQASKRRYKNWLSLRSSQSAVSVYNPGPIEALSKAMIKNSVDALKAGNFPKAVADITQYINSYEKVMADNPSRAGVMGVPLNRLYVLRAQAHYRAGMQINDRQQLELGLADLEKAKGFPAASYQTDAYNPQPGPLQEQISSALNQM